MFERHSRQCSPLMSDGEGGGHEWRRPSCQTVREVDMCGGVRHVRRWGRRTGVDTSVMSVGEGGGHERRRLSCQTLGEGGGHVMSVGLEPVAAPPSALSHPHLKLR